MLTHAQAVTGVEKLHYILSTIYDQMIPLTSSIVGVAQAIAGFGAMFYIGYRVWRHIANAEPIDFFPLFRPFVLIILIGIFPAVLGTINGILKPTVNATAAMVEYSNEDVQNMLDQRKNSILQGAEWQSLAGGLGYDQKDWQKYTTPNPAAAGQPDTGAMFSLNIFQHAFTYLIKLLISWILQIAYYAASLCIDVMRTFHLIILSVLGPFVFCMAVFDGFQQWLQIWLAKYINYYMWLPIANIFGALINRIQLAMLHNDATGDTFSPTNGVYLVFLAIAIVGYFSIPSIANYIVHAAGGHAIQSKTNQLVTAAGSKILGL